MKQTSVTEARRLDEASVTCGCLGFVITPPQNMALLEQATNAPPENCYRLVILGSAKVTTCISLLLS